MAGPYDLTPEEFQAMLEASLSDQRIALEGQNYKRGANDYATPQPGGRNLGYTYVASNPLEHLASAIRRVTGSNRMNAAQDEQSRQVDAKGQGMGAFYGATQRNAPVPVDYGALYGEDPVSAAAAANAMGGNVGRSRALSEPATILGGPFEQAGKQYGMEALTGQRDLIGVGQHRADIASQDKGRLQTREQFVAEQARKAQESAREEALARARLALDEKRAEQDNWAGSPDPAGGVVLYNRKTGEIRRDGSSTPGGAPQAPNFKSEAQGKAFGYVERLTLARKQMEEAGYPTGAEGYKDAAAMDARGGPVAFMVPKEASSEAGQRYFNAARNAVAALLRKESGAAINKDEWEQFSGLYIPREWDSLPARKNKLEMLDVMQKSLAGEAGPGAQRYWRERLDYEMAQANKPKPTAPPTPVDPGTVPATPPAVRKWNSVTGKIE
jgi:hypothetical protein